MDVNFIGVLVVGAIILAVLYAIGSVFSLWFQALTSNAPVGLVQLFMMRFRKVNATIIVTARITAKKAGLDVTTDKLEAHYMAGGHVMRVINALIAAHKANINLSFDRACAIDLAGRDVLDAVQTSVNPKVIDVPDGKQGRARPSTASPATASS